MSGDEDELVPISALQHLLFCERQCALIHMEQAWDENRLTVEGRLMHERVHELGAESRGAVRVARGLSLRSERLGLVGKADVVEFHRHGEGARAAWRPYPVEYKRGRPKVDDSDRVQLCAQALCLEEMLGVAIPEGALFYGTPRRRLAVGIDDGLRELTRAAAVRLHALLRSGHTPPAELSDKCRQCSLASICLPASAGSGRSARRYVEDMLAEEGGPA